MDKKIISIVAIVIIIGAAIGGVVFLAKGHSGGGGGDGNITIVDGSGKTITLSSPLTNVAVINSNIPKAMIMMDLDDSISTFYYGSNKFDIKAEELAKTQPDRNLGTYYTPSVETLVKYQVQAVICPVANMTLYSNVEKQCEQVGIKVIRLNCNGNSIMDDLTKISKVFGDPASAVDVLNKYHEDYNATINAVIKALDNAGGKVDTYLQIMTSREQIYNTSSEVHSNFSNIFKANITQETSLPTTSVTNPVNEGTIESIHKVSSDIDVVIIRSTNSTADNFKVCFDTFTKQYLLLTSGMPVMQNNDVYVLNTDLMSGMYAHIGLLIMVQNIYGITVEGYTDLDKVISDFQTKFSQSTISNGDLLFAQFGNDYPTMNDPVYYNASAEA